MSADCGGVVCAERGAFSREREREERREYFESPRESRWLVREGELERYRDLRGERERERDRECDRG